MPDQLQTLTELRAALAAAERAAVADSGLPEAAERIAAADKALGRARASATRAAEAATEATAALAAARIERADTIAALVAEGVAIALVAEAAGLDRGRVSEIVRDRRTGREAREG